MRSLLKNRKRRIGAALLIGLGLVVFLYEGCAARLAFMRLGFNRHDPNVASRLAHDLAGSPYGVRLALADMSIYGGDTAGGWSSQILLDSPLDGLVEQGLVRIAASEGERLPRRLEAFDLLWRRMDDTGYLVALFKCVREPGSDTVWRGRRAVAAALATEDLRALVAVPPAEPVLLTVTDFTMIVSEPGNLARPSGPAPGAYSEQSEAEGDER